ncbi:glycosyltransferase family 71 protein [Aureobasidium subglaciale EXF-2481]|uniref:Glycosyltransferase family 71 protein n=1 Tax=Aureobasidium subglaciale (strain EXF-2481) TaxID=1043005 RepID=A0A074YTN4_AURSE|nr:glycosyltransferase family 71 protein [Aureobasidium subglaciale EXF-2481]KEQ90181.1 glycosyltransferase family 71 protein [Aureobasidium subglaciale EXF-2481]
MKAGSDYVSETGSDRASVVDLSDDTESVPTAHKIGNGDKESLREALKDILDNMPDETHAGKLLQPLEGGGQERLKELGTKIRAFHKYFATWETLHVVNNSKLAYVRDDVIQYLENAPEKELSEVSQLERGDIVRAYERYRAFLGRLSHMLFPYTSPYFGDHMALHSHFRNGGRGIVLSGNDKQAPYILTSLKVIRKLGSSLPVEIMYLENELNEDWRTKLEAVPGVIARNLSQMVSDEGWELKGSASKPFALLMSSFREVIYLDADALFFVNPEVLFEDPGYVETGTLFFRDRITSPSSRKQWLKDMLPKPISRKAQTSRYWTGKSREQQDSGVLVVDKWRHFVAMLTVARMNGPDRDDNPKTGSKGVFSLFYGDKETFWLGWELAGDTDYWFNEGATGNMGITAEDTGKANDLSDEPDLGVTTSHEKRDLPIHPLYTISSPQLLHLSTSNRPLWFSGWILDDNFEDPKDTAISIWENYLSETKETNEPAEWRIAGHGMATLKSNKLFKFTAKENDALSMIVETAREVGAVRMRR